ncbi:uncharacterized protein LOC106668964 isoform X2 [Cimex lectularius]|nr:uncharacterized protein LOC106668964 isoform X2 [Cimex lectularius]
MPYEGHMSQASQEGHGGGQRVQTDQGSSQRSFRGGNEQLRQNQGRSFGGLGDKPYGASLIDTPTMVGYEAVIPGATSRFVKYRNEFGRSGKSQGGFGQSGQGGQGQQAGFRNSQDGYGQSSASASRKGQGW